MSISAMSNRHVDNKIILLPDSSDVTRELLYRHFERLKYGGLKSLIYPVVLQNQAVAVVEFIDSRIAQSLVGTRRRIFKTNKAVTIERYEQVLLHGEVEIDYGIYVNLYTKKSDEVKQIRKDSDVVVLERNGRYFVRGDWYKIVYFQSQLDLLTSECRTGRNHIADNISNRGMSSVKRQLKKASNYTHGNFGKDFQPEYINSPAQNMNEPAHTKYDYTVKSSEDYSSRIHESENHLHHGDNVKAHYSSGFNESDNFLYDRVTDRKYYPAQLVDSKNHSLHKVNGGEDHSTQFHELENYSQRRLDGKNYLAPTRDSENHSYHPVNGAEDHSALFPEPQSYTQHRANGQNYSARSHKLKNHSHRKVNDVEDCSAWSHEHDNSSQLRPDGRCYSARSHEAKNHSHHKVNGREDHSAWLHESQSYLQHKADGRDYSAQTRESEAHSRDKVNGREFHSTQFHESQKYSNNSVKGKVDRSSRFHGPESYSHHRANGKNYSAQNYESENHSYHGVKGKVDHSAKSIETENDSNQRVGGRHHSTRLHDSMNDSHSHFPTATSTNVIEASPTSHKIYPVTKPQNQPRKRLKVKLSLKSSASGTPLSTINIDASTSKQSQHQSLQSNQLTNVRSEEKKNPKSSSSITLDYDLVEYMKFSKQKEYKRLVDLYKIKFKKYSSGSEIAAIFGCEDLAKGRNEFEKLYLQIKNTSYQKVCQLPENADSTAVTSALSKVKANNVYANHLKGFKDKVLLIGESEKACEIASKELMQLLEGTRKMALGSQKSVISRPENHKGVRKVDEYSLEPKYSFRGSGLMVTILKGDIVNEKTDAIVNAANADLADGGGVTGAIFSAGGDRFRKRCERVMEKRNYERLQLGEVVVTDACGKLKCKRVLHTVAPKWTRLPRENRKKIALERLQIVCQHLLDRANIERFCSISIPALGTGNYGVPMDVFCKAMAGSIFEFDSIVGKDRPSTLKHIHLVNYDYWEHDDMKKLFQVAIS